MKFPFNAIANETQNKKSHTKYVHLQTFEENSEIA